VSERFGVWAAILVAAAGLAVPAATAASNMKVGIYDEGATFFDDQAKVFGAYRSLGTQILRVNLYWGGKLGVAKYRPFDGSDPRDAAYGWALYDRVVQYAGAYNLKVLFSITGTPRWANGGQSSNRPPKNFQDLYKFAYAAAARYSGSYTGTDGRTLPAVRLWAAWNEPNNPVFLRPQFVKVGAKWVIQSPKDYAKICNAIYRGIHATMYRNEKVACGVTAPRGNNNPHSARPSVSPVAFLVAAKKAGMKTFDAYAHNPYYGVPTETPTTRPPSLRPGAAPTAITLANINVLLASISRLYGPRHLWITEYGYQTKPPDQVFGVSWSNQARYLTQAFAIARKNPRIDMMIWFLLKDQPDLSGWQSGLMTVDGRLKPSFAAYARVPK